MEGKPSLSKKINALFAVIIVLACVVISLFSYRLNEQSLRSERMSQNAAIVQALAQGIDTQLTQVEIITSEMAHSMNLEKLLLEDKTSRQILSIVFSVSEEILQHEAYLTQLGADMVVLSVNPDIPEDYNTFVRETHLLNNGFYTEFIENKSLSAWGLPESPFLSSNSTESVLPFYYKVITGLNRRVGTVQCAVSTNRLFAQLSDYEGSGTLCVLRGSETLFEKTGFPHPARPATGEWEEENMLFYGAPLERLDAVLILGMDYGAIRAEALRSTIPAVLANLFVGIVLLIVTQRVLQIILKRLHALTDAVSSIPDGFYSASLPEDDADEVGRLAAAFDSLLDRTRSSYDALLQKEKDKRHAQSLALQYQINPHFLFNSLYWLQLRMEEEGMDPSTTESIEQLGQVLHYNLLGLGEALLSEEEEHVKAYVHFVSAMKGLEIRLSIHVPEALRHVRILRFTLQPLLENAIQHGSISGQPLMISIAFSADRDADRFVITVTNNGRRIPQDTLRELRQRLENAAREGIPRSSESNGHGTALSNLSRRLALTYDEEAQLSIHSDESSTCVTIVLPLSRCIKEDEDEAADRR